MKNTSKTITGLTLASAVVLSQANISHAQESNNKDKNSEMTQKLNDKDIKIKYADPKLKINTKTQKQADSNKEDKASDSKKEYNKEPKMDDEVGVYNYGAGDPDSGVNKASKIEQEIDDKDVSINKKNVKAEKSGIAMVMSPLKGDKNTYYAGSAFAVDKHTLLTNDHVAIDQAKKGDFKSVNAEDMIITPNRDSSEEYVPAELKAKDIKLLKSGDVAVIHTKEDLSKYMKINKIASEDKIKDEKEKGNITLSGYPGSRDHKDVYGDDYGPKGTPFDMRSKFIMHATSIHPVMYYKGYFEKGMSGSPIYNDEDEVIGIHAGTLDTSANGPKETKADLGYGFSITKDVKKDLDKELQVDETKEDETKAKDDNNKDQDNKKDLSLIHISSPRDQSTHLVFRLVL